MAPVPGEAEFQLIFMIRTYILIVGEIYTMEIKCEEPTLHVRQVLESMGSKGIYRMLLIFRGQDSEVTDVILFGYIIAWFLGELSQRERYKAIIAHFHEWISSLAVPLIRKRHIDVITIFTTHATLLGRYLCANSVDFYNNIQNFTIDEEAKKLGIYHRHCIERAVTHSSDVFITVSEITAYEAEHLLKRKPDNILPNGLYINKSSAMHNFQKLHEINKQKIHDFVRGHFYGYYDFNLDNTLYFFTAGRYEYQIRVLMYSSNHYLVSNSKMTIVAFIIMPAATNSFSDETLREQEKKRNNKFVISHLKSVAVEQTELLSTCSMEDKMLHNTLPLIVTHNMADENNDLILNQLHHLKLSNSPSDRVKVIFHPEVLNANNSPIGLEYDDFEESIQQLTNIMLTFSQKTRSNQRDRTTNIRLTRLENTGKRVYTNKKACPSSNLSRLDC
ncbi:11102_t:CDS:2 [Ambispora gerdemannii]|uniref:Glycogen [starch] synthase n=1 Tax=Ambispora gerdemannii TaxID=144530 RepID=A0A9N9FAL8_9GLOM|nr:11102_t:CDS:2 [Ambispora gerdemannii]